MYFFAFLLFLILVRSLSALPRCFFLLVFHDITIGSVIGDTKYIHIHPYPYHSPIDFPQRAIRINAVPHSRHCLTSPGVPLSYSSRLSLLRWRFLVFSPLCAASRAASILLVCCPRWSRVVSLVAHSSLSYYNNIVVELVTRSRCFNLLPSIRFLFHCIWSLTV